MIVMRTSQLVDIFGNKDGLLQYFAIPINNPIENFCDSIESFSYNHFI